MVFIEGEVLVIFKVLDVRVVVVKDFVVFFMGYQLLEDGVVLSFLFFDGL